MSIQTEITRLQTAKTTISEKLVEFGVATADDKLDELATALENIQNRGKATKVLDAKNTYYDIEAGYHNGQGSVSINVVDAEVQSGESQKTVDAADGSVIKHIVVKPIPSNYKNITGTNATAADVLSGVVFIDKDGNKTTGGMFNNGAVSRTLDMSEDSTGYTNAEYTVPAGYHNGSGKVKISFEEQQLITPDEKSHTVRPSSGKVLSTVYVEPIPSDYVASKTQGTATAADVLDGKTAYVNGVQVTGNIPIRSVLGDVVVDGLTFTAPAGYYAEDIVETAIDEYLTAGNIKSGVSIFNVTGSFTGDATAGASHIMKDYTAYVKGEKVTGTMPTYGVVENTVEWTDLSQAPYYSATFQGYVTGVNVNINTSTLETALSEI